MSRPTYQTGANTSTDTNNESNEFDEQISDDEQISEDKDIDNSYTSDENVDDSRESSRIQSRSSVHNYAQRKLSNDEQRKQYEREVYTRSKAQSVNEESSSFRNVCILFIVAIFAVVYCNSFSSDDHKMTIGTLRDNFPKEIRVISIIDQILNDTLQIDPTHPAVILLLYTGSDKLINSLTHNLALYASNLLQTNTDYIEIPQNEFHAKEIVTDYGILIEKYKPILLEKHVMVVKDLQNIPGTVAQVFHTFCDEISPLVDRAVYLLTLNVNSLSGKEETIAEAALNENWNELRYDILSPLVTRVTSTVLKIEN